MNTQFLGRHIEYYPFTDSTNNDIWELVQDNEAKNGTLVITDDQRKGKGRRDNQWITSPGQNLTFSFLLMPKVEIEKLGLISLLIGIAITERIQQFCEINCKLKWPNDVLIDGKKVGGILIESKEIENKLHICVGIGLNVNDDLLQFPVEVQQSATSLIREKGQSFQREPLLASILNSIEKLYKHNWFGITKQWLKYCAHLNSNISFKYEGKNILGIFTGLNPNGYAEIDCNGEIQTFPGGELIL